MKKPENQANQFLGSLPKIQIYYTKPWTQHGKEVSEMDPPQSQMVVFCNLVRVGFKKTSVKYHILVAEAVFSKIPKEFEFLKNWWLLDFIRNSSKIPLPSAFVTKFRLERLKNIQEVLSAFCTLYLCMYFFLLHFIFVMFQLFLSEFRP